MTGSCFPAEVGERMKRDGGPVFPAPANPGDPNDQFVVSCPPMCHVQLFPRNSPMDQPASYGSGELRNEGKQLAQRESV